MSFRNGRGSEHHLAHEYINEFRNFLLIRHGPGAGEEEGAL